MCKKYSANLDSDVGAVFLTLNCKIHKAFISINVIKLISYADTTIDTGLTRNTGFVASWIQQA